MTDSEIMAAAERLYQLLYHATDIQWLRPPVDHAEQVGGRGSDVSDPTADTALDTTRQCLRTAVVDTGRSVAALVEDLESALDQFNSRSSRYTDSV